MNRSSDSSSTAEPRHKLVDQYDVRVEIKLKNNTLWRAIHEKYSSVNALCKAHEELRTHCGRIGRLLRFKLYPFKKKQIPGTQEWEYSEEYCHTCELLELILSIPAEDLFPKHLYDKMLDVETERSVEVSAFTALPATTQEQIYAIAGTSEDDPSIQADARLLRERIEKVLKTLTDREREIIKLRYGIKDGYTYTLEEVANIFDLHKERIRQIEKKAMWKLQQPRRAKNLAGFIE